MRKGKIFVGLLTAVLLALLVGGLYLCTDESSEVPEKPEISLLFSVRSGQNEEMIRCWENPEGDCFVFLPGYAEMEDVSVSSFDGQIRIGETTVVQEMFCGIFELNKAYPFSFAGEDWNSTITFVRSGGIPSLYIDTLSGNMDYIHLEKGNEETGMMRLYGADGKILYSGNLSSVKGRGNTSWYADKKPYSLTLNQEADLLGMGAAQRWILLTETLRNKIVYDFAAVVGMPYSPKCEWVHLYLNGEYAGLYLLSERNEVHPERIDISKESSFLVSLEYESRLQKQKYPYVLTESGQALRIHYGAAGASQMQTQWQSVENAILAENGIDPVTGKHWMDFIDLDSWVRKYLIEEIFGNGDAGTLSQYYYFDGEDSGGKIFAGPVWDFDYSMGGDSIWLRPYTNYFVMNRAYVMEGVYAPWYPALYKQEAFYSRIQDLYVSEFLPCLESLIESGLQSYGDAVLPSAQSDSLRWGLDWENVSQELDYIESFLQERTAFLSDIWLNDTIYHTVCVDLGRKIINGNFAVETGGCLPALPSYEDIGGLGWYNADTDKPFDVSQSIYEDVRIYVKKPETSQPAIHYVPMAALVLVLSVFFVIDRYQTKKNGRRRNDTAKIK